MTEGGVKYVIILLWPHSSSLKQSDNTLITYIVGIVVRQKLYNTYHVAVITNHSCDWKKKFYSIMDNSRLW